MDVISLTRQLVALNTVSHQSSASFAGVLAEIVHDMGFTTEYLRWIDSFGVEKVNLVAKRATHDGRSEGGLLLAGHIDTVPFRTDQKATTESFLEGAHLYGRGTCDMKGGIAAQLEAASRFRGKPLHEPLTLAFTSDEEIGCLGAKALITTPLVRSAFAIIGEPTSLKPIRMHKGYFGWQVTFRGRAAHSSDPRRGISALKAASRAILSLEALEQDLSLESYSGGAGFFDPDYATLNVGLLQAGVARNVIPEICTFTIELRPLPGQDVSSIMEAVETRLYDVGKETGTQLEVCRVTTDMPMETDGDSPIVQFLEELTHARAGAVAFSTEGKEFNQLGIQSVIFGPGSIQQAHQEDEYVPLEELGQAAEIYAQAIERFCVRK